MKTTVELPDDLFREAKATAARSGRPLKEFFREAVAEKLARAEYGAPASEGELRWPVPPPKISREDAELIDRAIDEAFEQIEPDEHM